MNGGGGAMVDAALCTHQYVYLVIGLLFISKDDMFCKYMTASLAEYAPLIV